MNEEQVPTLAGLETVVSNLAKKEREFLAELRPATAPEFLSADRARIWNIYERLKVLALHKNLDYGGTIFKRGKLTPDIPADAMIRARMDDKIGRIQTMLANLEGRPMNEPLADSVADLGTYCFLWLICKEIEADTHCMTCGKHIRAWDFAGPKGPTDCLDCQGEKPCNPT